VAINAAAIVMLICKIGAMIKAVTDTEMAMRTKDTIGLFNTA
jgi:hypothetical protein